MSNKRTPLAVTLSGLVILTGGLGTPRPAAAQDAAAAEAPAASAASEPEAPASEAAPAAFTGIEEVVVTSQKRAQNLQDVPLAISALTGDALLEQGLFRTTDLASRVPNLQISSFFGESQPNFTIRGVGVGNEFSANQASPVGVYVDENYISARLAHGAQLYDMERVEVVKGPQGTLYGRNTTGGAMNFITNKPKLRDEPSGTFKIGYGNYNRREGLAVGDYTLLPDKLGVRAAVNYVESDGLIDNKLDGGGDISSVDNLSGRLSVRLKPSDSADLNLKLYTSRTRDYGSAPFVIGYRDPANPGDRSLRGNVSAVGYARPAGMDFFESEIDLAEPYKTDTSGVQFNAAFKLDDALSLTSITGWDSGEAYYPQDVDGGPLDALSVYWGSEYTQFNQDLRLAFTGERLTLIGGLYFGTDTVDIDKKTDFVRLAGPNGFYVNLFTQQKRDSYAAYAEGAYKLTDAVTFTVGTRYTSDELDFRSQSFQLDENGTRIGNLVPGGQPGLDENAYRLLSDTTNKITGRAILDYKYADNKMVYVSASRGYRAPAVNGNADTTDAALAVVAPETLNAYETGLKSRFWDNRIQFNAAVFYYDYQNQQVQEVIGSVSELRSSGPADVTGAEIEIDVLPTDHIRLNTAIGLLKTEYKELVLSGIDLRGNEFINAPKVTATVGGDWDVLTTESGGVLTLHLDTVYTAKQYFSPFNDKPSNLQDVNDNRNLSQDPVMLWNSRVSYETGPLSFGAWVKNITEEEYFTYGLGLRDDFGIDFLVRGQPRTFGADVTLRF